MKAWSKRGGGGQDYERHQTFDGSENNSQLGASTRSRDGRLKKEQISAHYVDYTESTGIYTYFPSYMH